MDFTNPPLETIDLIILESRGKQSDKRLLKFNYFLQISYTSKYLQQLII